MSHDILPFTSPLYNTVADIRYNISWVWKREKIRNQKYLWDCSKLDSYDYLRDNLEINNTTKCSE